MLRAKLFEVSDVTTTMTLIGEGVHSSVSPIASVIKGKSAVSPEMALRLSKVLGRTPQSWLAMQDNYEIWQTEQRINLSELQPLKFLSA